MLITVISYYVNYNDYNDIMLIIVTSYNVNYNNIL